VRLEEDVEERERAAAFLEEAAVVRRREDDRRVRVDNMIVLCLNALGNGKWIFNSTMPESH